MNNDETFFYQNGGFSWNPKTETQEQGKIRCAKQMARAEAKGRELGFSFSWEVDQYQDSSSFSEEQPAWALWNCACHAEDGEVIESLCGIDFGPDGKPWHDKYRRVVEAELAAEGIDKLFNPWNVLAKELEEWSKEICELNECSEEEHNCESYAYLLASGQLLDVCTSDYFQGTSKPHAAVPLPWVGSGEELREEVLNQCAEMED